MRIVILIIFLLGLNCKISSQEMSPAKEKWEQAFSNPPESTKPYVYWYWDNGNISKEGITRDLEAMAEIGIGEAMISNVIGRSAPDGKVSIFSEEWWDCMVHAVCEAGRLGIKIGVFNCPGWSQSGGPWVQPEQAMRYLVSREMRVEGNRLFQYSFQGGDEKFQPVSVQAFPAPAEDDDRISTKSPVVSSDGISFPGLLFDGDTATITTLPKSTTQIEIKLSQPVTIRSFQLIPAGEITTECELEARKEDGGWQSVTRFKIDRGKTDVAVGPMRFGPVSVNFPARKASEFRITFAKGTGGKLSEIELSGAARLTSYVEKQLGKMSPDWEVAADTYHWPASVEAESPSLVVNPSQVIDLSSQIDSNGMLKWQVPAGKWIILYTGMLPTGTMNSPTRPEGIGLEIDKMNKELAQFHFDSYIGKLLERIPADRRNALRHVVADSYEKGPENWTDGFAEDFIRTYGYDPYPWLPVLTGRIVESADRSERFLWDMRRLIADRIASEYVGGLRERCEENGLRLWIENYGHWGFPGEFLNYGGASHDLGGEFWLSVPTRGSVEVRCAASAGHIYGKKSISAEAFTSHWSFSQMPRDLKLRGDWAWCEGINHFVLHVYLHQPDERKPGISAWFGTDFNRHGTWFSSSKSYIDYIRRSCALLQSGNPVADVAYFIGEDVPKMTGDREPALPRGYDYDFINAEVLLKDASVADGRIVLSSGVSYAVLVLPPQTTMRPEMLEKIAALVKDGACIVGNPPECSPSGQNYPECDSQVETLARQMWGTAPEPVGERFYGKGHIFSGMNLQDVLRKMEIAEDCLLPDSMLYTHRQEGNAHLYFVSNQKKGGRKATIAFRVTGLQPELWNPVTGVMRKLTDYEFADGKTFIPLEFGPEESWFVVFREEAKLSSEEKYSSSEKKNFPACKPIQTIEGNWTVNFTPVYAEPFQRTFSQLTDWSCDEDPQVKYYSGKATYSISFNYNGNESTHRYLNLGKVEGIATVRLNGYEYPALWCYPYRIDISKALRSGTNRLEIEVVNCWWNRLVGDKQPETTPVTWTSFTGWNAHSPLLPSGLLGPVEISVTE